jgi:hypothetical protein
MAIQFPLALRAAGVWFRFLGALGPHRMRSPLSRASSAQPTSCITRAATPEVALSVGQRDLRIGIAEHGLCRLDAVPGSQLRRHTVPQMVRCPAVLLLPLAGLGLAQLAAVLWLKRG